MIALGAALAMADLTGDNSGASGLGPNDPFLFGFSNGTGYVVDLNVTTASGTYTFTTNSGELTPGLLNQGWWSNQDGNINSNSNILAGQNVESAGDIINDFFTFNMNQNAVVGPILSATLSIPTAGTTTAGLPLTYYVGSVADSTAALANKNNNPNAAITADLGTANYGSVVVANAAGYTSPLNIALDAQAISDISSVLNSANYFSIGGTIAPTVSSVPEPVSLLLLGTVVLGSLRQIRRKAQS
jgi:hypothetical protein